MNGYKKIIRSQKARFAILRMLKFIPDEIMLGLQYRIKLGRKLNLEQPQRYTEKIQWYKLYYRNPIMTQCVDKYHVREYVKKKGFSCILNELYQVTDNPDRIDFDALPSKFVLKITNGSETNIFCMDKSKLDIEKTKKKLREFLSMANVSAGREWAYEHASRLIVAEKLMEDDTNPEGSISDYKFLCFGGKPEYIVYDCDRFVGHKRNIYDIEWNNLNIDSDCPRIDMEVPKPANLSKMLAIAKKLSEDFPAVRVDLYNIKGKIIFGELTFYPWSGYVQYNPDNFDYDLGEKFILPGDTVCYKSLD